MPIISFIVKVPLIVNNSIEISLIYLDTKYLIVYIQEKIY